MVEKWKLALKEFLGKYEEDDDVIGAVLCGSYANDNYNEYSDINVYLILKNSVNYQEKGNTDSNSYLIEYFKNPIWKIKKCMEDEYNSNNLCTANMFAYGKIIYDLDGSVKMLQSLALDYIDKPFKTITQTKLLENNHRIWDLMDELKVSLEEDRLDFKLNYYNLLNEIYEVYCEYYEIAKLPKAKLFKILTNEEYRKKYHTFKLPNKEFTDLYLKCYEENKASVMYKNIENLVGYYYKKQGGFNIRTFVLKNNLN